jgi:transposase
VLVIRPLTEEERQQLVAGLEAERSFTRRRCQILLSSAQGRPVPEIAAQFGCNKTTVWEAIHAFNRRGLACLRERRWQRRQPCSVVDASQSQRLRLLLQTSPTAFGKQKSRWSLALLAEVCCEQGLAAREISREGMRQAVERLGIQWKQAKRWAINPELP